MTMNVGSSFVWTVAGLVFGAVSVTVVVARPGGGGSETPCFKDNPAYTNGCSHWVDSTDPEECPDITSGTSNLCPGVMHGTPGSRSFTVISVESCHIIQKYWDPQAGECVVTEFDQPVNCTQPSGQTCW